MIAIVLAFFLGVCTLSFFPEVPSNIWIFGLTNTVILSLLFIIFLLSHIKLLKKILSKRAFYKKNFDKQTIILWVVGLGICFGLGLAYVSFKAEQHLAKSLPYHLQKQNLRVLGIITSVPEKEPCGLSFDRMKNEKNELIKQNDQKGQNDQKEQIKQSEKQIIKQCYRDEMEVLKTIPESLWKNPGKIRLRSEHVETSLDIPKVGDKLELTLKLKRPRSYSNPGSFDKEKHYFLNRWVAEGYVVENEKIIKYQNETGFRTIVDSLRESMKTRIAEILKYKVFSGMIIALTTGLREGVTEEHWRVLRETGTTHLMTISGLEMGVIFSLVWRIAPQYFLKIPVPIAAGLGGLILAVVYAFLSGFSIATQRTLVMVIAILAGTLTRRLVLSWHNYFLALGIVLLMDPLSFLSPGFWLSFFAAGLMLYGLRGRIHPKGWWWKWGRAQWVVLLGLIPITLAAFQEFSWIAPIANLIAVPCLSLIVVPLAFMGGSFSFASDKIAKFCLTMAEYFLGWLWVFFEWLLKLGNELGGVSFKFANFTFLSILLAGLGVILLLSPRGWPAKYMAVIWILPLFWGEGKNIGVGECRATILDVGQGLSVVIETQKHVILYDTGPKLNPKFDTGERVVLPFLARFGKNKVDLIVISHADNDHVGGLGSILNKGKGRPVVLTSEEEKERLLKSVGQAKINFQLTPCMAGQTWMMDGVKFEILHPSGSLTSKKRNDHSCVLKIEAGEDSLLLTGDIEERSEREMIQKYGGRLKSKVLLVPHHGSKTSSSLDFIKIVNPEYAVIPVGYLNQFGHPREEIVRRYRDHNIKILSTVQEGGITFKLGNKNTLFSLESPVCYRKHDKHFWTTEMPEL